MEREILFRGQTRKYGERVMAVSGEKLPGNWVYGGIFPAKPGGCYSIIYTYDPIQKLAVYSDTVGEYTGQIDKSGTKIFEGDICRNRVVVDDEVLEDDLGDVRFYHGSWTLMNSCGCIAVGQVSPDCLEVIGNIHDNPEFLNEQREGSV